MEFHGNQIAFTGQERFIHRALAFEHDTISGTDFVGINNQRIPNMNGFQFHVRNLFTNFSMGALRRASMTFARWRCLPCATGSC